MRSSSEVVAPAEPVIGPVEAPSLDDVPDANVHGNRNYWGAYDWPEGGDEWSLPWGGTDAMWFSTILPRIAGYVPSDHILEIAPGFGRCTQFLRFLTPRLTIVDLVPKCIEACRRRFSNDRHIASFVNNGRSLGMVEAGSVGFAFSWDSLVHAEHETLRAYVFELRRVLRPGGVAFVHHSNLGEYAGLLTGEEGPEVLGGRRPTMTAAKFRADCAEAGLRVLSQELVPWTGTEWLIDSLSVCMRDEGNEGLEAVVVERRDWKEEVSRAREIAALYRRPVVEVGE